MSDDSDVTLTEAKPAYIWVRPVIDWAAHLAKVNAFRAIHGTNWDSVLIADAGCGSLDDLPHFSHPTFACAPRDSVFGGNLLASLFHNVAGHTKLLVVHNPGVATAIPTVMDNEVTIKKGAQIPLLFGAAQKGCAMAIDFCVAVGILPQDFATRSKLVCGIEVYLDPTATDAERIQDNIIVAVVNAIVLAVTGGTSPENAFAACKAPHVFAGDVPPMLAPDLKALGLVA